MSEVKTLFKNVSWVTLSLIVANICAFIWTISIARYLGVNDYGILSFAISFTVLLGMGTDIGMTTYSTREISKDNSMTQKFVNNIIPFKIVLSVLYRKKTIQDILEEPISDIIDFFKESKKIYPVLKNMMELGLGYLKLGQMSMNLSGGEAQRIKLAKALGTVSHGHNLYILDEPTSGLSDTDIEKFVKNIFSLQSKRDTIIIIEHNIKFIAKVADYIIDFGLRSGEAGGKIAAQGFPKSVFSEPSSSLYGLDKLVFYQTWQTTRQRMDNMRF